MSDRLIERADSLMHHRTFVAGAHGQFATPNGSNPTAENAALEEVPVLTEVVADAGTLAPAAETSVLKPQKALAQQLETAVRDRLKQLLTIRQAELAQEIETWLDEQMPQLVIRAMDGITDHLVALLANRARDELLPRLEAALRLDDADLAEADSAE